jgi:hypothetical protein
VHGGDIRNYSDFRLRNFSERRNLPRMRHAQFHYRDVVLRLKLKQHQWKPKVIVEISFRLVNPIPRSQNVCNSFFGRGLAGRSGHPNQGPAPEAAHRGCQGLECEQSVVHY